MNPNPTVFRVVSNQAALNPVAQAVARKRLQDAIRVALIDLYTLEAGTVEAGAYITAGECVAAQYVAACKPRQLQQVYQRMRQAA